MLNENLAIGTDKCGNVFGLSYDKGNNIIIILSNLLNTNIYLYLIYNTEYYYIQQITPDEKII